MDLLDFQSANGDRRCARQRVAACCPFSLPKETRSSRQLIAMTELGADCRLRRRPTAIDSIDSTGNKGDLTLNNLITRLSNYKSSPSHCQFSFKWTQITSELLLNYLQSPCTCPPVARTLRTHQLHREFNCKINAKGTSSSH